MNIFFKIKENIQNLFLNGKPPKKNPFWREILKKIKLYIINISNKIELHIHIYYSYIFYHPNAQQHIVIAFCIFNCLRSLLDSLPIDDIFLHVTPPERPDTMSIRNILNPESPVEAGSSQSSNVNNATSTSSQVPNTSSQAPNTSTQAPNTSSQAPNMNNAPTASETRYVPIAPRPENVPFEPRPENIPIEPKPRNVPIEPKRPVEPERIDPALTDYIDTGPRPGQVLYSPDNPPPKAMSKDQWLNHYYSSNKFNHNGRILTVHNNMPFSPYTLRNEGTKLYIERIMNGLDYVKVYEKAQRHALGQLDYTSYDYLQRLWRFDQRDPTSQLPQYITKPIMNLLEKWSKGQ